MAAISRILVSSSAITLDRDAAAGDFFRQLKPDQVLKARVLKVISPRQALFSIAGRTVTAQTFVPVREGETVLLKTTATAPQPRFALVGPAPPGPAADPLASLILKGHSAPLDALASLLKAGRDPDGTPPEASLSGMRDLLLRIAGKAEAKDPSFLQDLIRSSGLLWERKLKHLALARPGEAPAAFRDLVETDLKGLALHLLAKAAAKTETAAGLTSVLKEIETLQLQNSESTESSGKLFLPLPLSTGTDLEFGQLLIDLGGAAPKTAPENRLVRIAFLLSMTGLGDLRADFSVWDKNVSGAFQVADRETQRLFQEHFPLLADSIQALGFAVKELDCRLVPPETLKSATLADTLLDREENLLNVLV